MKAQSGFAIRCRNGCVALLAVALCAGAQAYESGSTGADGFFNPTADIEVPLPPSGIFNFSSVTVPAGVTVTFTPNAGNTPVRILVSGDVIIDGTISVDGQDGGLSSEGGPGGRGGPGGYAGGPGGLRISSGAWAGGVGLGPGAGVGGRFSNSVGGAAGFGVRGDFNSGGQPGPAYGNVELLPLIGGSGGGGGAGGASFGTGGSGGGGALLIAANGTVTINGSITASPGTVAAVSVTDGRRGGVGSGGGIRIVATTVAGEGVIDAYVSGRIRIEADNLQRLSGTSPAYTFSPPQVALIADAPQLRIVSIGGIAAPATPSGFRDVVLPGITSNPVSVVVETTNVPLASIVTLRASPTRGASIDANGSGVTGSQASGSDTISIDLPAGNSMLVARANFVITAELGDRYAPFAGGERVASVELSALSGAESRTTYITVSGKRFTWGPQGRVN